MTAWDLVCWVLICLLGGIFPARTARRFLAAPKSRICAAAPCLVIGAALGMPTWVGDGNPLYLFPVLLASFLIGYGGSRLARLVVGVIFFEWIIAWSMIVDTIPSMEGRTADKLPAFSIFRRCVHENHQSAGI